MHLPAPHFQAVPNKVKQHRRDGSIGLGGHGFDFRQQGWWKDKGNSVTG